MPLIRMINSAAMAASSFVIVVSNVAVPATASNHFSLVLQVGAVGSGSGITKFGSRSI